jgi:hypothetical protein
MGSSVPDTDIARISSIALLEATNLASDAACVQSLDLLVRRWATISVVLLDTERAALLSVFVEAFLVSVASTTAAPETTSRRRIFVLYSLRPSPGRSRL